MKRIWLLTVVVTLGFILAVETAPAGAQKTGKALTLLYSNNVNGELDPCPT